jgi:hypothetical protein
MPIKKIPNNISLQMAEDTLSFYSFSKRNHFGSDSKLFDDLLHSIKAINHNYSVYLSLYPHIAVHVSHGIPDSLAGEKTRIQSTIQQVLERQLRQT